jgi:hypothetical protein
MRNRSQRPQVTAPECKRNGTQVIERNTIQSATSKGDSPPARPPRHECETRPRTNVSDAQRHTRRQSKSGLAPHATHARSAKRAPSWDTAGTYAFRRVAGVEVNRNLRCVAPNRWHSQRQSTEATQPTEPRPKQEPRPKHERVDVGALQTVRGVEFPKQTQGRTTAISAEPRRAAALMLPAAGWAWHLAIGAGVRHSARVCRLREPDP